MVRIRKILLVVVSALVGIIFHTSLDPGLVY